MASANVESILVALKEIGAPSKPKLDQVKEKVDTATQADLDSAWVIHDKAVKEKAEKDKVIAEAAAAGDKKIKGVEYTSVTNNANQILNINGVDIPAGGSADVPEFDSKKPLMAAWIKAKVLVVGKAPEKTEVS